MKNPLVSICIPTHNRPEFLKLALSSALKQSYKNTEIIISDNSDNNLTKKYIEKIKNKKIKYFKNDSKSDSFNNGLNTIKNSRGKYIKILMDDDLLERTCVEKMVSVLEKNPKVGVVMSPLDIIDKNGLRIYPKFYFFKKMKYLYRYLTKDSYVKRDKIMDDFLTNIYPCCVPTGIMYRKKLLAEVGGYDEKYSYISDVDICMNFATKMDFYYIDEVLSSWRFTETSETVSILHKKGIQLDIFYQLANKYLSFAKNKQNAFFFASKRTTINIVAGIKSGNIKLIFETIKTIIYNDPYLLNKFVLPFNLFFEVIKSSLIV